MDGYHARICIYKAIWPPCGEETGGAEKDGGLDGEAVEMTRCGESQNKPKG